MKKIIITVICLFLSICLTALPAAALTVIEENFDSAYPGDDPLTLDALYGYFEWLNATPDSAIQYGISAGSISAVTVTKKLTASSTSGGIAVRQGGTIGTVDLDSTSGSISCTLGANAAAVTARSTSGSISLDAAGSVETVKLESTFDRPAALPEVYIDYGFWGPMAESALAL